MFISYLTSAANDICKDAKRQTISAEDVFTALQDLDFSELISPTKDALEGIPYHQTSKQHDLWQLWAGNSIMHSSGCTAHVFTELGM